MIEHPHVEPAPDDASVVRKSREEVEASLEYGQRMQIELGLTIMETRIRLAELMATLRRISFAVDRRF